MDNAKKLIKLMFTPKEWKNFFKNYREQSMYIIFGVLTTIVSYVTYFVFDTIFKSGSALPKSLSWVCAVTFAYVTNKIWVFKSKGGSVFREISSFVGGRVVTGLIGVAAMWLLVDLPKAENTLWKLVALCVSSVFELVMNYFISKIFVFRKKQDN